jgi:RNA polymerase sigma factor (sigma-70 family)
MRVSTAVSTAVKNVDASALVDFARPSWRGASRSRTSSALLKTQSDARLTQLTAEGYEAAFETLIGRYRSPLLRYARRFLTEAPAEDVVQQAFMDLWATLSEGEQIRNVRAWLYRVVRNAALNTIRRASHRCEELQETVDADSPELAFERRTSVREALTGLASLPALQREAMMRNAVDGHSRTQIAMAMGLSDGAVGQMLHRARCSLRGAMSAIVPLPLASWAAGRPGYDPSTIARMLQLTTTSAGSGPAAMLMRGGAALAVIAAASTAPLITTPARQPERAAVHVAVPLAADLLIPGDSNPLRPFSRPPAASNGPRAGARAPVPRSLASSASATAPDTAATNPSTGDGETVSAEAAQAPAPDSAAPETAQAPAEAASAGAPPAEAPPAQPTPAPEGPLAEAAPATEPLASEAPPAEAPTQAPAASG